MIWPLDYQFSPPDRRDPPIRGCEWMKCHDNQSGWVNPNNYYWYAICGTHALQQPWRAKERDPL